MFNKEKLQQVFDNLGAVWHAIWMKISHNDNPIYTYKQLEIEGGQPTPIKVDLEE